MNMPLSSLHKPFYVRFFPIRILSFTNELMHKQVYVVQQPNQCGHYSFQKYGKQLLRSQFIQILVAEMALSPVGQPWNAARPQSAPLAWTAQGPQTHLLATLSWLLGGSSYAEKNTVGLTSSPSGVTLLLGEDKNVASNLKTQFSSTTMKGKEDSKTKSWT